MCAGKISRAWKYVSSREESADKEEAYLAMVNYSER